MIKAFFKELCRLLFGFPDPIPEPCPYCSNPDRNSVFEENAPWDGCAWEADGSGGDPPCVCDSYATDRQLSNLGLAR